MAREKGTSQFAGTYEVQAGAALDPRLVVDKLSDLTSADTWPTSGTGTGQIVYIYNGMVVSVLNDNAGNPTYGTMYELVDKTKYTSLSEGWKKLNTGNDIICNSITVSGAVTAPRFNGNLNGNASTATKLATAVSISLGDGVNSTAVSFDGSTNITIPVTSVKETYLSWGGKEISGGLSPVDAATDGLFSANRLSFMPAEDIKVEYSNNTGTTWTDYGLTNNQKISLVTTGLSQSIYPGKKSPGTGQSAKLDQVRVTITANNMYFASKKIYTHITSGGASGCKIKLEYSTIGNDSSFTTVNTYSIAGWPSWNSIPCSLAFGGNNSQSGNIRKVRLTFYFENYSTGYGNTSDKSKVNFVITKIAMIGPNLYENNNGTLAGTGHMYSWNVSKYVTFPAKVIATAFEGAVIGNVTGNLTGNVTGNLTGNVTGNLTGTASNASKFNNESSTFYFRKLGKNTDLNSYGDYSNANGIIYINTEDKDSINSPFKYGSVLSLNYEAGSWMLGVATDGELRFRERWWSSRDGGKEWSSWVTILNSNNYSSYAASKNHTHTISAASSTATVSSSGHTHSVTAAGSVASTFTGSAVTSGSPSTTSSVASSTHTHSVTAAGSVASTFTGSAATSGSSGPSVTYDSATLVLSITTGHTHSVTAAGSVASTFTGSAATSDAPSGTATVASTRHTHSVTAAGSVSSTFTGSAATSAASSATTTVAKSDHTHSITN